MKKVIFMFLIAFTMTSISSYGFTPTDKVVTTKTSPKQKTVTTTKVTYTCPMHPEVMMTKPGKCPKCGMKLEKKEVAKMVTKVVYTCPMHKEVAMAKAGKCPKCGMDLVKKETAKKTETKKM